MTDIRTENGKVRSVVSSRGIFESETVILAIGHSARDTFEHLFKKGVTLIPKAFSVGLRIEHLQKRVNESVYGRFADKYDLPAAEYAVSAKKLGRGCYSFCMCPGGSVIAASSEEGMLVTNGMSYHARNGSNANSALCVSVNPDDFERSPLGGIAFQRSIEKAAFEKGGGGYAAPIQTVGDFLSGSLGTKPDTVKPSYPLPCTLTDFSEWMPEFVTDTLKASFSDFSKSFSFFSDKSAVFTGVETRTSSPVRIIREEDMQASGIKGLFPCGEGAGYAGGIMSAAVDGIKAAKQILSVYKGVK